MTQPPSFAVWLQRQLQRRGWSGSELARRMDVPAGTVNNWARGVRKLTDADLIHRMADALNVHQDEILEQLDMREGGADRMSLAVRRLQPLIDSIEWNEDTFGLVEPLLRGLRGKRVYGGADPEMGIEDE